MIRKRKTIVTKRVAPKAMAGIQKPFGVLNDPLGNHVETNMMAREETEQRRCDRFWGQDKDLHDREVERQLMSVEDDASLRNEQWYEKVQLHRRWDEEYQHSAWSESRGAARQHEAERKDYLKYIGSSLSSDEVIGFVWNRAGNQEGLASHSSHSHASSQSQDPHTLDLSAIGQEVALSLPATVGALHLSVHLDGLQQSRAIIDSASSTFKNTLRRINSHSADQQQPARRNPLAAILRNKGSSVDTSSSVASFPLRSSKLLSAVDAAATAEVLAKASTQQSAVPAYVALLDGHAQHKWDQELLLQLAFISLDKGGKGFLNPDEVAVISYDQKVHALLRYTVFWAHIKKRNWVFFEQMSSSQRRMRDLEESTSLLSISATGLTAPVPDVVEGVTVRDWLAAAQGLALEKAVPLRHIRTQAEHVALASSSSTNKGVGAANVFSGLAEREHRVARALREGDCVWALHCGGVVWLPAVVKAVHAQASSSVGFVGGEPALEGSLSHCTISYSGYRYDLQYPLSQRELQRSRALTTSKQLLALPSQQQLEQRAFLQPRPLEDERSVCAFAFDLVDGTGGGIVPLARLVECMRSLEFSRIVQTSLALSVVFHGGSYVANTAPPSADESKSGSFISVGSADLPSLLPVFVDTFSAPTDEDLEAEEKEEEGEGETKAGAEARERRRRRKSADQRGAQGGEGPDWISKLDFLEFCEAVVDIKRLSVTSAM